MDFFSLSFFKSRIFLRVLFIGSSLFVIHVPGRDAPNQMSTLGKDNSEPATDICHTKCGVSFLVLGMPGVINDNQRLIEEHILELSVEYVVL